MTITLLDILSLTSCVDRIRVDKLSDNKIVNICEGYRDRDFSMDELCKHNTKEVIAIEMDHDYQTLVILLEEEPK